MFYKVFAFKDYDREQIEYLESLNNSQEKNQMGGIQAKPWNEKIDKWGVRENTAFLLKFWFDYIGFIKKSSINNKMIGGQYASKSW